MPRLPTSGDYANAVPQDRTGVAGVSVSPVGAAISGLGEALDKELLKIDTLKAEDAYNKAAQMKADLSYGEDGYEKIKGGNVLERPVSDEYTARFKQGLEGIASGLKSPRQKALFNRISGRLAVDFGVGIQRHLMTETDAFNKQVKVGTLAVETDNIIRNWDNPQAQERSFERLKDLRDRSLADGDAVDFVEAQYKESLSKAHLGVVQAAIDNKNFDYAKGWLATHSEEIGAAAVENAKSIVVAQEREVQAMDFGRTASGLGLLAGDAALVKRFGDDPEMLKTARAEMRDHYALQKAGAAARQSAVVDSAYAYVQQGGRVSDMSIATRRALGKGIVGVMKFERSLTSGEKIETDWALYEELMGDPDRLSKTNLTELLPYIGRTEFKELVKLKAKLNEDDKPTWDMLSTRKEVIDRRLREAKIPTTDKARVGRFRDRLDKEVPKDATPEELENGISKLLRVKTVRDSFFGIDFDKKVKAFEAPVTFDDFDPETRQTIIDARKADGLPIDKKSLDDSAARYRNLIGE